MVGRIQSELWDVALDQHGFVTTNDARTLGVNPLELVKLAARNQLLKVGHGIYRFPQLPTESLDSYMLAVLWARGIGVISHDTALDLHELCEINPDRIHLTVPGRRPRRAGGDGYVVHHGVLAPDEITRHEGIPIVKPAVAIRQAIASGVRSGLLHTAIETARGRGLISRTVENDLLVQLEARA